MLMHTNSSTSSYGSRYEALYKPAMSTQYDDQSLSIASNHIAAMSADFGGTEVLPPLKASLQAEKRKEVATRQIFLLTDGDVGNGEEVSRLWDRLAQHQIFGLLLYHTGTCGGGGGGGGPGRLSF